MDFLHREITLPFRLSVVLPAILSYSVVLVFASFCLLQITEGVVGYKKLRQEGWWPNCPTSKLEDNELPVAHPRSVCLEQRKKTDFFLTEGVINLLIFLVLFILLHLSSKWEAASAIVRDPQLIFFSWLIIISIYLITTFLAYSERLSGFVWRFGGGYSVVSLYQLLRLPQIRKAWWWATFILTLLLCSIFILFALLKILATVIVPFRY